MSSCTKQNRAALMKWWEASPTHRSMQGSSYGHYSQGPATQAIETVPTPTAPATQSATACPAAALPADGTSPFACALFPPSLRRGFYPADFLPLLRPGASGDIDHRQPHGPELAAHAPRLGARIPFQLQPRLLETT